MRKKTHIVTKIFVVVMFLLLLPVLFFVVYFFVLGDPIGRMALHESAKRVMTDIVGIEGFRIDQADIINASFDPVATWQILLDHPFRYQDSHLKKPDRPDQDDLPDYIETVFGNMERGFGCFAWEHMVLGPGTVCGGVRTCAIEVCVKEGSRSLYVTIMVL